MSKRSITVQLTPVNGQISWVAKQTICCARNGKTLQNYGVYEADDLIWSGVFGSRAKVTEFMKTNVPVTLQMNLGAIGYDSCDFVS